MDLGRIDVPGALFTPSPILQGNLACQPNISIRLPFALRRYVLCEVFLRNSCLVGPTACLNDHAWLIGHSPGILASLILGCRKTAAFVCAALELRESYRIWSRRRDKMKQCDRNSAAYPT